MATTAWAAHPDPDTTTLLAAHTEYWTAPLLRTTLAEAALA